MGAAFAATATVAGPKSEAFPSPIPPQNPTNTATPTPKPAPAATPTATLTPVPTAAYTPTPIPTAATATPTATLTPTPTPLRSPTPAPTLAATANAGPTPTPVPTPSPEPTLADLDLDPFYEKYVNADGLAIVSSGKVPDAALERARDIIDDMLANRADIRATMARWGMIVAIMAVSEVTTDIPEHSDLYEAFPETDWDERARGLGPTLARRATSGAEENLLCYDDDKYSGQDILVHEFAHAVVRMGLELLPEGQGFRNQLSAAYTDALEAGLWENTYAADNPDEYWAEGVQAWFDLNGPPGATTNYINTRSELESYDPRLATLIKEVFGDATVDSSCHPIYHDHPFRIEGIVAGPQGDPLPNVRVYAWQGQKESSGAAWTNSKGEFDIRVPNGAFSLDIYAGPGCSFVGWYGGSGITDDRNQLQRVIVNGTDVGGIEIRLPMSPVELPRIEWCASET